MRDGWLHVGEQLTLCMLDNFSCIFCCHLLTFFSKLTFSKILLGIPSERQTIWIKIRPDIPDILSGLIWVQTVCNGYQQPTKVATGMERVKGACMLSW